MGAVKALSIVNQLNKKEEKQLPNISRELTSEKACWLEKDAFKKETLTPKQECSKTPISKELTTERHRRLEEEKTETILEKETLLEPISRDQTAVKALSIVDQLNKKEEKQLPNISRELTSEKACWLEKDAQTLKPKQECSKTPISQELTTESHRWLEEEKTETILE